MNIKGVNQTGMNLNSTTASIVEAKKATNTHLMILKKIRISIYEQSHGNRLFFATFTLQRYTIFPIIRNNYNHNVAFYRFFLYFCIAIIKADPNN